MCVCRRKNVCECVCPQVSLLFDEVCRYITTKQDLKMLLKRLFIFIVDTEDIYCLLLCSVLLVCLNILGISPSAPPLSVTSVLFPAASKLVTSLPVMSCFLCGRCS